VRSPDAFLPIRGAKLRVLDEGSGPALVLLHGWAFDLDLWELQAAGLTVDHRVIRYDRRGFGSSSGEPSLTEDVADLLAILDQLSVERALLVGASQAARVVLRAALAAPGRVAGLVLDGAPDVVSAAADSLTASEIPIEQYRALARRSGVTAVRSAWFRHPLTQLKTRDLATRARLASVVARYPGRDLTPAAAESQAPLGPRLADVSARTLVINGEFEVPARLASGVLLCSTLPNARRVLVPGAAHLANLDNPSFYNDMLVQFSKESFGGQH
jgi:pimeloyl-ACP methyl ester carboxylesterase